MISVQGTNITSEMCLGAHECTFPGGTHITVTPASTLHCTPSTVIARLSGNYERTAAGVARATRLEPLLGVDNDYNTQLTFFIVQNVFLFDEP